MKQHDIQTPEQDLAQLSQNILQCQVSSGLLSPPLDGACERFCPKYYGCVSIADLDDCLKEMENCPKEAKNSFIGL